MLELNIKDINEPISITFRNRTFITMIENLSTTRRWGTLYDKIEIKLYGHDKLPRWR